MSIVECVVEMLQSGASSLASYLAAPSASAKRPVVAAPPITAPGGAIPASAFPGILPSAPVAAMAAARAFVSVPTGYSSPPMMARSRSSSRTSARWGAAPACGSANPEPSLSRRRRSWKHSRGALHLRSAWHYERYKIVAHQTRANPCSSVCSRVLFSEEEKT
jgi:hypothetical protein